MCQYHYNDPKLKIANLPFVMRQRPVVFPTVRTPAGPRGRSTWGGGGHRSRHGLLSLASVTDDCWPGHTELYLKIIKVYEIFVWVIRTYYLEIMGIVLKKKLSYHIQCGK